MKTAWSEIGPLGSLTQVQAEWFELKNCMYPKVDNRWVENVV